MTKTSHEKSQHENASKAAKSAKIVHAKAANDPQARTIMQTT
jgi:hypothetical protein